MPYNEILTDVSYDAEEETFECTRVEEPNHYTTVTDRLTVPEDAIQDVGVGVLTGEYSLSNDIWEELLEQSVDHEKVIDKEEQPDPDDDPILSVSGSPSSRQVISPATRSNEFDLRLHNTGGAVEKRDVTLEIETSTYVGVEDISGMFRDDSISGSTPEFDDSQVYVNSLPIDPGARCDCSVWVTKIPGTDMDKGSIVIKLKLDDEVVDVQRYKLEL